MYSKLNIRVLRFNPIKDVDKIIFNHYIMRRVNANNIYKKLETGYFTFTISGAVSELGFSKGKVQRLIKSFEELGIISRIVKGNKTNKCSIYKYITDSRHDTKIDTKIITKNDNDTNLSEILYISDFKDLGDKDFKGYIDSDTNNDNKCVTKEGNLEKDNINKKINNIYVDVVNYLNEKCKKNFKPTTNKTKNLINARINEGFELEDFKKVIDIKSKEWMYSDMQKYLRPETLFSNKFEGYLNEEIFEDIKEESSEVWDIEFDY